MPWSDWIFSALTIPETSPAPPRRAGFAPGGGASSIRALAAALLMVLAACDTPKPNFLEVIQRDCAQGNAEACEMLASVSPAANEDTAIAPPVHSRDIVQAILAGMRRARQNYARHDPHAPAPVLEDPNED